MITQLTWSRMELINPDTKKVWSIEIDGNIIRTCLNHGKIKEKEEKNPMDKACQAVMGQMRKGFLYKNQNVANGEVVVHQFIDKPSTGFMPIAARGDRSDFYVIRTVGEFEDEIVYHFDEDGQLIDKFHLGEGRLTYCAVLLEDGTLLLDATSLKDATLIAVDPEIAAVSGREHIHRLERFYPKDQRLEIVTDEESVRIISNKSDQVAMRGNLRADATKGDGLIEIYDCHKYSLLMEIQNEFTVRNTFCDFSLNRLILHTDYGAMSLYKMET